MIRFIVSYYKPLTAFNTNIFQVIVYFFFDGQKQKQNNTNTENPVPMPITFEHLKHFILLSVFFIEHHFSPGNARHQMVLRQAPGTAWLPSLLTSFNLLL